MSTWQERLDAAIDALFPSLVELRRHLHANPEPSGAEDKTSLHIYQLMDRVGLAVRMGPGGRGVLVDAPADNGQPRVALRADMDALLIQDRKTVDYRSQVPGVMHACGHDGHTATVVGAVLGLQQLAEAGLLPWEVPFRAIFQPAEETSVGALEMIGAGALENVDGIFSLHMDPSRPVGRIGVRVGALTASCDDMFIDIFGRGGHAARPHESIDPIAAAAQLVSSIYLFVPRAVDTHDPVVVTIGQIHGGDNPNVIPESCILRGTLRSFGKAIRERTKEHIRKLARGLAEVSGAKIDVRFEDGPPSVMNAAEPVAVIRAAAAEVLGPENVDEIPKPSMGGEDFAYYLTDVPGAMFRLGCCSGESSCAPLHSPLFDIDERALAIGAKTLARAAIAWSNPARRQNQGVTFKAAGEGI